MEIWKLLFFIPVCFALNLTPGPNNLLSMNNARCYGFKSAFIAGLGRIAAFSVMIALAASGLAVALYASETLFLTIKIVGAAYLLWIAFNLWCSKASPISELENTHNRLGLVKQEFLLAAGNPKAILFYMGVLPGFFDLTSVTLLDILAIVTLSMAVPLIGNVILAIFINRARRLVQSPRALRHINIISGGLLIGVGCIIPFI